MTTAAQSTRTALRVRDLRVSYGRTEVVLGVDLDLPKGSWTGLIGPNGSGKSSMLGAMAGLRTHTGSVLLADGRRPSARDLALVPQNPVLPEGMNVTEYVLAGRAAHLSWFGRESARDRRIAVDVLRRLDLAGFAARPVTSLSGGEAQRVVVARALAQQARILLLDEPTSALDLGHQNEVLELVDHLRLADGLTVLAAMHDLTSAARFADGLVLMDAGTVVARGAPATVLDPVLLSGIYRTPLTVRDVDGELAVLAAPRKAGRPRG